MRLTLALYLLAIAVSLRPSGLRLPLVLTPPPNTNTVGIHAVWDPVPFADSYDLAWGVNLGIYTDTTNIVSTGAIFRWPATNAQPWLVVRTHSYGQVSDWSAPFGPTNYVTVIEYASPDLKTWTEIGRRTNVVNAPMWYARVALSNWNNYPTLP